MSQKEKLVVELKGAEIEILYRMLRDYFFESALDPQKEEEFRKLDPLYDEIKAAMQRMYPEYFKFLNWDNLTEPLTDDDLTF
jgi:hypothetical protein